MIVKLSSFSPNINTSPVPALIRVSGLCLNFTSPFPSSPRWRQKWGPAQGSLRLFAAPICSCSDPRGDADLILVVSICNEIHLSAYPRWGMCLLDKKVRIHSWCEKYMIQNQQVRRSWCERRGASHPTVPLFHPLLCPLPSAISRQLPQVEWQQASSTELTTTCSVINTALPPWNQGTIYTRLLPTSDREGADCLHSLWQGSIHNEQNVIIAW